MLPKQLVITLSIVATTLGIEGDTIIIIYCLTSDSDPYWPTRTTPYIHIGRKLYLRKPCNLSPRLLGLAYKAPIRRLQVTSSALLPYFLTSLEPLLL